MIKEFQGPHRFLSNFWPCSIVGWEELEFPSSEHLYAAAKCYSYVDDDGARLAYPALFEQIRCASTPAQAKRLGAAVPVNRAEWDGARLVVMRQCLMMKFGQNPDLMERLKGTGDEVLEEGNWWGDKFWGVSPAGSGHGENNLGKLLMWIRDEWDGS